jgi:hypothetical protein
MTSTCIRMVGNHDPLVRLFNLLCIGRFPENIDKNRGVLNDGKETSHKIFFTNL